MKNVVLKIQSQTEIAPDVWEAKLCGDVSAITAPGQFVNLKIEGFFLRRPISVCDVTNDTLTLIYKVVGRGTEKLSEMTGQDIDALLGLGNGYDLSKSGDHPLLIGGGAGVPPLYLAAKALISEGKKVSVILGFNTAREVFYQEAFSEIGADVFVTTVDGSCGIRGYVTDAMDRMDYSYFYACGPEPMLKAVYNVSRTSGQFSFEERMGCGFGACMGCSCKTVTGFKRICKEGPVLEKEEILWQK